MRMEVTIMQEPFDQLWNEYFAELCATVETEQEKHLAKRAAELGNAATAVLTAEQNSVVEAYVNALMDSQSSFVKKAFFVGCRFAAAFFLEFGVRR